MTVSFSTHLRSQPSVYPRDEVSVLFHYTNFSAAIGIIGNKEIWATNMHCLNDEQEFVDAVRATRSELQKRKKNAESNFIDLADELLDKIETVAEINIHVTAFSEEDDLLSQWRGYCPNGGLALGFSFPQLQMLAKANNFYIGKCVYDRDAKSKILNSLIDRHLTGAVIGVRRNDQAVGHFISEFVQWAPFFKHEAFSEEKEWRLVSRPVPFNDENVAIRSTSTAMVPYYRFKLDRLGNDDKGRVMLGLRWFIIGPQNNQTIIQKSLSYLLSRNNLSWHSVGFSRCPYRTV